MLPMATRTPGLSGSAGDQLFALRSRFWLLAAEKVFILNGDTPENCPKREGLQCSEKSHLWQDASVGIWHLLPTCLQVTRPGMWVVVTPHPRGDSTSCPC